MIKGFLGNRDKRYRKKEREDWMWYEDPYKADTGRGTTKSSDHNIPAPSPVFGSAPTLHAT